MSGKEPLKRLKLSPTSAANPIIDRISELPEALIIHILSFLPTTDRIKTGSLSKRWKHLWTIVPKLYFTYYDDFYSPDSYDYFCHCVNQTIHSMSCSKIESFGLDLEYDANYDSQFYGWTRFATNHHVKKFKLDFYRLYKNQEPFLLPSNLYTNSSFIELVFIECRFDYASRVTVSWNSLKKLKIGDASVCNKALENILAGTPLLEILDLGTYPQTDTSMLFQHPGLKKLIYNYGVPNQRKNYSDNSVVPEIEISAPKLESLELRGNLKMSKVEDVTSLKKLKIHDTKVSNKALENILAGTPLLEILDLCTYHQNDTGLRFKHPSLKKLMVKVFNHKADSVVPDLEISAPKLVSLELEGNFKMSKPVDATSLIDATLCAGCIQVMSREVIFSLVNRPTLTLDACSIQCRSCPSQHDNSNMDQIWKSQDVASNYFTQLRTVKFKNFWSYRTIALPFVQLLLRYAKVLQKMVIYLEATYSKVLGPTEISEISQKVLTFQRSSPDAQVYVYPR